MFRVLGDDVDDEGGGTFAVAAMSRTETSCVSKGIGPVRLRRKASEACDRLRPTPVVLWEVPTVELVLKEAEFSRFMISTEAEAGSGSGVMERMTMFESSSSPSVDDFRRGGKTMVEKVGMIGIVAGDRCEQCKSCHKDQTFRPA